MTGRGGIFFERGGFFCLAGLNTPGKKRGSALGGRYEKKCVELNLPKNSINFPERERKVWAKGKSPVRDEGKKPRGGIPSNKK